MAIMRIFGPGCWHGNAKVVCVRTKIKYVYVPCKKGKVAGPHVRR